MEPDVKGLLDGTCAVHFVEGKAYDCAKKAAAFDSCAVDGFERGLVESLATYIGNDLVYMCIELRLLIPEL